MGNYKAKYLLCRLENRSDKPKRFNAPQHDNATLKSYAPSSRSEPKALRCLNFLQAVYGFAMRKSRRQPVKLPAQEWKLRTGVPGNKLLQTCWFEDLYFWRVFEISKTVLGARVKKYAAGKCDLLLSPRGRAGLHAFMELFPEWPDTLYMRIAPRRRASRLLAVYGENCLVLEPRLDEIPPDLSDLLIKEKIAGRPPVVRGANLVDLVTLKIPRFLPAEHRNRHVAQYLNLIYADDRNGVHLRIGGRGGIASRYRRELELVGRYRLLEANGFDLSRTILAAHDDIKRPDKVFRQSRKFVEGLLVHGDQIFDRVFGSIARYPSITPSTLGNKVVPFINEDPSSSGG
jgi:hypothetical protein